jgi:hypothetical protein
MEKVMRFALRQVRPTSGLIALAVMAGFLALASCSLPENEGFVAMNDHPAPFKQARGACFESSMGSGYTGGNSTFGDAQNRYNACMARSGWAPSTHLF